MPDLITASNLPDPDRTYAAIIDAHRGLSDADSQELNARLVLILVNHIGSDGVLRQALELAQRGFNPK
ncbi:MAG: DUF2783 domain-containing protein [Hyphomicrobiaceae bacterium]|nr:MAG: DUF2783 domain-containing protein [Hyphomicrobiaceae bacterium]